LESNVCQVFSRPSVLANFIVKASSDDAYRRLIRYFVGFYREALFNDHWGEQAHFSPDNKLEISMVHLGLDTEQSRRVWQPFLNWLAQSSTAYTIESEPKNERRQLSSS
jgi:hypothetical protein